MLVCMLVYFHHCDRIYKKNNRKNKTFSWFERFQFILPGLLLLGPWACDEALHHGREHQKKGTGELMAAVKREKKVELETGAVLISLSWPHYPE